MSTSRARGPHPNGQVVPLEDRRARRQNRKGKPRDGSATRSGAGMSITVHAGVPVVTCGGHLGESTAADCAKILAHAVRLRPRAVVVDLGRATLDEESVPVLRLMRHITGRHGIRLALAALSPHGLDLLRRGDAAERYEVYATLPLAVGTVIAQSHRSLPRRQTGN